VQKAFMRLHPGLQPLQFPLKISKPILTKNSNEEVLKSDSISSAIDKLLALCGQ